MHRFLISFNYEGQLFEALVQYNEPNKFATKDTFSVHPAIQSPYFASFDLEEYVFESDRPLWRSTRTNSRPTYSLHKGQVTVIAFLEATVEAIDAWVIKNLDN